MLNVLIIIIVVTVNHTDADCDTVNDIVSNNMISISISILRLIMITLYA